MRRVPSKSDATVWFDLSFVLHLEIGGKSGKAPMTKGGNFFEGRKI